MNGQHFCAAALQLIYMAPLDRVEGISAMREVQMHYVGVCHGTEPECTLPLACLRRVGNPPNHFAQAFRHDRPDAKAAVHLCQWRSIRKD